MITFILNDQPISTEASPGSVVLDFIRNDAGLKGTKEACREGDCGACTIMVGELIDDDTIEYHSVNSCLLPLGQMNGKHVVTIEGINHAELNPLQQAFVDEGATQCGFCTPGFIMSLTAYFLSSDSINYNDAITAVDGNICRCTGYASIQRAIARVCQLLLKDITGDKLNALISHKIIPTYFKQIPAKLNELNAHNQTDIQPVDISQEIVAGGTDLFVQRPDDLIDKDVRFLSSEPGLTDIWQDDKFCYIGAGVKIETIRNSDIVRKQIPKIDDYFRLFASTPIRNQATLGGNLVNASPIGDTTIFFLALNVRIGIANENEKREFKLKDFYVSYKKLNKKAIDIVEYLKLPLLSSQHKFNFEKVAKRTYLDIASVNSAVSIRADANIIQEVHLSAGGVSPIPLYLAESANYLVGREVNPQTVRGVCRVADAEIAPISDVRGSEIYKRLLLRQLIFAHFINLFPDNVNLESLYRFTENEIH
ncbi:FAD binding domain-containing protein [candidate division KSB1 bacterium]|nr:FAD binding domain-containing protein [candidate division KSB1 bacterium]